MATWIDGTDSARYALVPDGLLSTWEGTEADHVIAEHVSSVRLADRDVLTLGGEPLPVAWLAGLLTFARWYCAEDDTDLVPAAHAATARGDWQDVLSLDLGGRYVLTDAGYDGDRILRLAHQSQRPPELLHLELPFRRYRVQSLIVHLAPDTRFVLERLLPE